VLIVRKGDAVWEAAALRSATYSPDFTVSKGFSAIGLDSAFRYEPLARSISRRRLSGRIFRKDPLERAAALVATGLVTLFYIAFRTNLPNVTGAETCEATGTESNTSSAYPPRCGIRFPQNPCTSCPYVGLCQGGTILASGRSEVLR
jgi:hypothetical protein